MTLAIQPWPARKGYDPQAAVDILWIWTDGFANFALYLFGCLARHHRSQTLFPRISGGCITTTTSPSTASAGTMRLRFWVVFVVVSVNYHAFVYHPMRNSLILFPSQEEGQDWENSLNVNQEFIRWCKDEDGAVIQNSKNRTSLRRGSALSDSGGDINYHPLAFMASGAEDRVVSFPRNS